MLLPMLDSLESETMETNDSITDGALPNNEGKSSKLQQQVSQTFLFKKFEVMFPWRCCFWYSPVKWTCGKKGHTSKERT